MRALPLWKISRIMIDLDGTPTMLFGPPRDTDKFKHGCAYYGQADLTYEEAERLIGELQSALQQCRELDALAEEGDKQWEDEEETP